jgi:hypothetical protein
LEKFKLLLDSSTKFELEASLELFWICLKAVESAVIELLTLAKSILFNTFELSEGDNNK